MGKAHFKMEYRSKIENGDYTLETREGRKARIICWDAKNNGRDDDIIAMVSTNLGGESIQRYGQNGKLISNQGSGHNEKWDLFVVGEDIRLDNYCIELTNIIQARFGVVFEDPYAMIDAAEDILKASENELSRRGALIIPATVRDESPVLKQDFIIEPLF